MKGVIGIQQERCIWCRTRSCGKDDRFSTLVNVGEESLREWEREKERESAVYFLLVLQRRWGRLEGRFIHKPANRQNGDAMEARIHTMNSKIPSSARIWSWKEEIGRNHELKKGTVRDCMHTKQIGGGSWIMDGRLEREGSNRWPMPSLLKGDILCQEFEKQAHGCVGVWVTGCMLDRTQQE